MRSALKFLFFLLLPISVFSQTNSVLSTGTWYKITVKETGIYTLTYSDLQAAGINLQGKNPSFFAVYGNGGGMLPQKNSVPRPEDLIENHITVTGSEDNSFDPGDLIIFYAEGPHIWKADTASLTFSHEYNVYSDVNYYFLTLQNPSPGKRVTEQPAELSGNILSSFSEKFFHEKDLYNVYYSGREWFGELFKDTLIRNFNLPAPDFAGDAKLTVSVLGRSTVSTSFKVSAADSVVGDIVFNVFGVSYSHVRGDIEVRSWNLSPGVVRNGVLPLKLEYDNKGVSYTDAQFKKTFFGSLNFIEWQYERHLKFNSGQMLISNWKTIQPGNYTFKLPKPSSEFTIWNISDKFNIRSVPYSIVNDSVYFNCQGGQYSEFAIFENTEQKKHSGIKAIPSQNIRGTTFLPELIIVTFPSFKTQALQLADFKASIGISTLVVTTEEIFNEFSSGRQDVTAIRDMARFFYLQNTNQESFKYLLLFGDASYDYKDRIADKHNFVPIYQSRQSGDDVLTTYASDDYYGFMDSSEGNWGESPAESHKMDIGVGRLPVKSVQEASAMVEKIKTYTLKESGDWQTRVTLFAEDGDYNLHLKDSEKLYNYVNSSLPHFETEKIYLDAYPQIIIDGVGQRSPAAVSAINQSLKRGTLVFNFIGHGGYTGGTTEEVITRTIIQEQWDNEVFPFFITATCGFATFDNPIWYSAGEILLLKRNGGGIGIVSGTRPAYSTYNSRMNDALFKNLFQPGLKLGDVVKNAKNQSESGVYNRHFAFLGDPSLHIRIPENTAYITQINNNTPVINDTLKALSHVTITGEIIQGSVSRTDFNGSALVRIYDKEMIRKTLGSPAYHEDPPQVAEFKTRNGILAEAVVSVTNGIFTATLLLPKSAADSIGSSRITVLATTTDHKEQAAGAFTYINTGGLNLQAPDDFTPPSITLFMDREDFVKGDSVQPNTTLIANLFDENGINQASSDLNNALISIVNSDSVIVMSRYYKPELNNPRNGKLVYKFSDLPEGKYTLNLSASDNYNNRTTISTDFFVFDTILNVTLPVRKSFEVKAYPNPFIHSSFVRIADHSAVTADIIIYSASGVPVKTFNQVPVNREISFQWDGRDESGSEVQKGIYICKIRLSGKDGQEKIVMLQKQ